jgi:excisionase family DNA binding protein
MATARKQSMEGQLRRVTPLAAPSEQQAQVIEFSRVLERMAHVPTGRMPRCQLVGPAGERIVLPDAIFSILERVTEVLARGDSIAVVAVGQELTTQQAADLLNVSRQYLVRLLDEGRIPFRKTGQHRRVRIEDVVSFKERRDKERRAGIRDITRLSEELGGYAAEQE